MLELWRRMVTSLLVGAQLLEVAGPKELLGVGSGLAVGVEENTLCV